MNEQLDAAPVFVKVPDGKLHLGDIVISYPTALKQALEHNHPVNREIAILLIHGILHLLAMTMMSRHASGKCTAGNRLF